MFDRLSRPCSLDIAHTITSTYRGRNLHFFFLPCLAGNFRNFLATRGFLDVTVALDEELYEVEYPWLTFMVWLDYIPKIL